jgi:hypothetical protein
MAVKKIARGLIYGQTSEGQLVSQMALTKQSSATVEGKTLSNRQYLAVGRGVWNMKAGYAPGANPTGAGAGIRVSGVVSGCEVTGDGSTNNVQVAAGIANVNGTRVSVGADTSNTITRGASGKYAISAVHVNASGTLGVTKGTDGDAVDFSAYDGAGQPPLVATTSVVLAYVVTYGDGAAVIPNSDTYAGESANVSYTIDPLRGGIVLLEALPLSHTGAVSRTIYAAFYDLTSGLSAIGAIEEGVLTIKRPAPVATPSHDSVWDKFEAMPTIGWGLTVKKWRQDQFWADKMLDPYQDTFYLKLTEDQDDAFSWYGFGILNGDYVLNVKKGPVSESLTFTGTGELRRA